MRTLFTHRFRVKVPLVGAPMAGISGGALAASVSRAGALGFIAAAHLADFSHLRAQVDIFRKQAPLGSPLSIGFICFSSMKDGLSRVESALREHKPDVVQYFAPAVMGDNIKLAHSLGALVICQVGSERDAVEAMSEGADAVIVQGKEAGGHGLRPHLGSSTLPLAARVAALAAQESSRQTSVLAAGGIVDGRGLAAALALGCDGAVFGTRLWASKEAMGPDSFKQALIAASPDDVARTTVFDQVQNSYRDFPWPYPYDSSGALRNTLTEQWLNRAEELAQALTDDGSSLASDHRQAEVEGLASEACVFAGEGVGDISAIDSAESLVRQAEADARLQIERLQRYMHSD